MGRGWNPFKGSICFLDTEQDHSSSVSSMALRNMEDIITNLFSGPTHKCFFTIVFLHITIVGFFYLLWLYYYKRAKLPTNDSFLKQRTNIPSSLMHLEGEFFTWENFFSYFFACRFHTSRLILFFTNKFSMYLRVGNGYISLVFVLKFKIYKIFWKLKQRSIQHCFLAITDKFNSKHTNTYTYSLQYHDYLHMEKFLFSSLRLIIIPCENTAAQ